jgi:fatty-acyl-CoA synthase
MNDHEMNEATIWEAVADALGGAPAIVQGELVRSWQEFEGRAASLASALAEHGIRPGDRVAIDLYNCPEYPETVFAAFKLRAVPINVNYRYRERELDYLLKDSGAKVVVFHNSLGERVRHTVDQLGRSAALVQIGDETLHVDGADSYEDVVGRHRPAERIVRSGEDDFILYTGGTTGMPRGVVWSHRALFEMQKIQFAGRDGTPLDDLATLVSEVEDAATERRSPVNLIASPLMHGTALFTSMGTFTGGGCVVLSDSRSFNADEVWRLVAQHRIRQLTIVGDVFAKPLLEALDRADFEGHAYDVSSLQRINSVGVTFSAPIKKGLLRHGDFVLTDGIAATEGGGFGSEETRRGEDVETARFKLGPRARVITDDGRDVVPGSGEIGYLAVTGSALPKGYLNDPDKTARTFPMIDGARYSVPGDMARIEIDGTLVFLGRGSEIVNTGARRSSLKRSNTSW